MRDLNGLGTTHTGYGGLLTHTGLDGLGGGMPTHKGLDGLGGGSCLLTKV